MPKSWWMLSAGLFALATPALAQDVDPAQEAEAEESGEIIVTAQGRSQALADVPLAISAVNAEALQNSGANDIRQLNQLAPSLLVSSTGTEANGSARIRGIGTVGDNPGLESSVAVFIDGVYRSRSGVGLNELGEIERVEVLRGPQGTLFGRNASAGLISVVSKAPSFTFGATGEASYGNFDYFRLAAGVTGPLTETLAGRIDGVYSRRDGFYNDAANNTDVNDRDRFFVRGQLLFEPTSELSFRLIGDYTIRNEACCGAVYIDDSITPLLGGLHQPSVPLTPLQPNGNNIINVLNDLGQSLAAFDNAFSRELSVTPGRSYDGETQDWGVSLEANWDLGFANLTSITGYRDYDSDQGSDTDYSTVDILYREADGGAARRFQTFSQELRLQGEAFGGRLDWLVGAYYADEDLTLTDNLRFGDQYGRFVNCRIISGGGLAGLYSPNSPSCVVPGVGPATLASFGADIANGFALLDTLNDLGTTSDRYLQNSRNFAFFTHNIIHITDRLDLTLGLRYTNERKTFDATFGNDNTVCPALQGSLLDDLASPSATVRGLAGALIAFGCQGNSTAELNGVSIDDRRSEDEFTGTGILSWKPVDDLLLYASYSRGYKAGGFNLDRSALKSPILPFAATPGGADALTGNLEFDSEINDAYEIGAKFTGRNGSVTVAIFRQEFENFQLNTFNGSVFLVQTVNGCTDDLGTGPTDLSPTTGACDPNSIRPGVISEGVEVEVALSPIRDIQMTAGLTYADTSYVNNLVGSDQGIPLDPALRVLPGNNLSNAPELVVTGSFAWTPDIGSSGLSGLFYIDSRLTSDFNTGSDLFPQKLQESFAVFNARIGLRGPDQRWGVEFWGQNIFNQDFTQVTFNTPFQAGTTSAPFVDPQFPGGRQIFSSFLAEPRTYGITLRGKF